ncbi:histidine kinase [Spirosoma sp. SC4-14]|uniref:sensor histidine kinase n=1 Tax=Spirosoma sp. SC4-14 TaxID=3128900 RepID=UPI0030CC27C6
MVYETWLFLFLGMMAAILLYNIVQWAFYRERIYGLYTVYLLIWFIYFPLRSADDLPEKTSDFVRITGPMLAYLVYYDFTIAFLNLRQYRPHLLSLFRFIQSGLGLYIGIELIVCFLTDYWQQPVHELIHTVVRISMALLSGYLVAIIYKRRDPITRFFITGSAMLVSGALVAMILTMVLPDFGPAFWRTPLTYLQIGILLELLFFSLGLTYRHRRAAVKKALFEQALAREREQRQYEQNRAGQTLQQLQHEVAEMQMRALQAQLSPHFLFNSLNSLSSLIADNPPKAERFVDELSNVYRYLLQASDHELIPLARELTFIGSYYHLLKTRYGQAIDLEISVDQTYQKSLLPPITLQLLVENAVKHNVVSVKAPLLIKIFTDNEGFLIVRNNLQRKQVNRLLSTKKGLQNINRKYQLLNQPTIDIAERDHSFDVIVPLIPEASPVVFQSTAYSLRQRHQT